MRAACWKLLLLALCWAALAAGAAQESGTDSAGRAALVFGPLQAGAPIRQGYAYQVGVIMQIENRGGAPSAETELRFVYTTITGQAYLCLNQSFPSRYPEQIRLEAVPPGERRTLSGQILIPAGWYRGRGTLAASTEGGTRTEVELTLY